MSKLLREYVRNIIAEATKSTGALSRSQIVDMLGGIPKAKPRTGGISFSGDAEELASIVRSNKIGTLLDTPVTSRAKGGISDKNPTYTLRLKTPLSGGENTIKIVVIGASSGSETSKDPLIVRGQILSAIAEHACIEGLNGDDSFSAAISDKLVSEYAKNASKKHMNVMSHVYQECLRLTKQSRAFVDLKKGKAFPGNVGTTTAKVDVKIKRGPGVPDADVHVKFNDFDRLIGLQAEAAEGGKIVLNAAKLAGEIDENWPVAAKYKYLRNKFVEDVIGFKSPDRLKTASITALGSEKELQMLQDPKLRKKFLSYLSSNGIPDLILKEIKQFFTLDDGGTTYFYKFGTNPKDLRAGMKDSDYSVFLHVTKMIADPDKFSIRELKGKEDTTTYLYAVSYDNKDVFVVEARTSGTKHPMQLQNISKHVDLSALMEEEDFN